MIRLERRVGHVRYIRRVRPVRVLVAGCMLAASAVVAQSPCETCKWAERGDRWEGIVDREQISGGSFELVSVHYQHPPAAASRSEELHLSFWLPEPVELDELRVWQPDRLYSMEPIRKHYGGDRQDFSWPRDEVVGRLGLPADSLYARIRAEAGSGLPVYYPALISTRAGATPAGGYAFVFKSGAGIDADCTIARRGDPTGVVRSFACWEDVGGTIVVDWDGRDENGQAVARGFYVLSVTGDMLAETLRPLRRNVSFWHSGFPSRPDR